MKYILFAITSIYPFISAGQSTLMEQVEHKYVNNDGVKIHYVTTGSGDPILFVHGFPDFWYTWRDQMESLSEEYQVAAVDLRGYNLSDAPSGVENYQYEPLIKDLVAVIKDLSSKPIYLVAHDWGAAISWRLASAYPELISKLVIISVPHPKAGDKINNDNKEDESSYADRFVSDEFINQLSEYWLSGWVTDPVTKPYYLEAFKKSDKEAMINYYKANFSTTENLKNKDFIKRSKSELPNLKMPVLIIHGKEDPYLSISGHNNSWDFIDNNLSIEILNNAGHFVQQDESEKLTILIRTFLKKD